MSSLSPLAVAAAYSAHSARGLGALYPATGVVPQPRHGRAQNGITAEMKPEQDDRLEAGGDLSTPEEFAVENLQPPEIVA